MKTKVFLILAVIMAAAVMFTGPTMSSANDGWGGGGPGTIPTPQRPPIPEGNEDVHSENVVLNFELGFNFWFGLIWRQEADLGFSSVPRLGTGGFPFAKLSLTTRGRNETVYLIQFCATTKTEQFKCSKPRLFVVASTEGIREQEFYIPDLPQLSAEEAVGLPGVYPF